MNDWIAFRIDGFDADHRTPVAVEATRDDAQSVAIQRILSIADVHCEIGVQQATDLTPEQIRELKAIIDKFWADRGIVVTP